MRLAELIIRYPKLQKCLLILVSQFPTGSPVFCPSKFTIKFAMEQTLKNYVSSPGIETEFGIYHEDLQAWPRMAALLAVVHRLSCSEEDSGGSESMAIISVLASHPKTNGFCHTQETNHHDQKINYLHLSFLISASSLLPCKKIS